MRSQIIVSMVAFIFALSAFVQQCHFWGNFQRQHIFNSLLLEVLRQFCLTPEA